MYKKTEEEPIHVPRFEEKNGFYTTQKRSNLMSKISAKETKPEILLRKTLWNSGIRYRKNVKTIIGKPDIVIRKHKLIIFIDGEFWHGYNWVNKKKTIKSNRAFWIPKIERNMQRDKEITEKLENEGWTVLRFWANEVLKNTDECIQKIKNCINYTGK